MRRETCSTTTMCRFSTNKNERRTEIAPRFEIAGDMSTPNDCQYCGRASEGFRRQGYLSRAAVQLLLFLLPEQLQSQLNLPGARGGRSDNAGRGRCSARRRGKYNCVWGIEVRVIENVKKIRSELRAEALRQRESFRDRQIQLGQSRSLQRVAPYVPVGPIGRRNEGVRIEVSVRSTENKRPCKSRIP